MARKAGTAELPLHGGHVPRWLADRMTRLGALISEIVVHHYGRDELLRRLAHPFWFQAFGTVMGMDEALKKYGKNYEFHRYPNAGHGFFYYTRPAYRPEQAMDGWNKIWAFLEKNLS